MGFKLRVPKISVPKINAQTLARGYVKTMTGGFSPVVKFAQDQTGATKKINEAGDSISGAIAGNAGKGGGGYFVPASMQAEADRAELYRNQREQDLAAGRKRGEEVFSDGALGRLDETIMNARKQQAEQGFTGNEMNALRDQNLASLNQQNAGAARNARIQAAAEGVRGGRAVAMNNRMLGEQSAAAANSERELFLKGIESRRQGLTDLEAAQKYNQEQKNRELQGRLTTELGYGGLGAAERGAAIQAVVGQQQAAAAANSGGKGKK